MYVLEKGGVDLYLGLLSLPLKFRNQVDTGFLSYCAHPPLYFLWNFAEFGSIS
jgi:hypothetical protein